MTPSRRGMGHFDFPFHFLQNRCVLESHRAPFEGLGSGRGKHVVDSVGTPAGGTFRVARPSVGSGGATSRFCRWSSWRRMGLGKKKIGSGPKKKALVGTDRDRIPSLPLVSLTSQGD